MRVAKLVSELQRVEDVHRPLLIGEWFLVPCIVRQVFVGSADLRSFDKENPRGGYMDGITPVFNHPHNDVENGQRETHYHIDFRFVKMSPRTGGPERRHSKHYFCPDWPNVRPQLTEGAKIEYLALPVLKASPHIGATPPDLISKSKLKHRCIHKGKCPHRGYNLSQVEPQNGVIRCPLHGLQFDATTGGLLTSR